MNPANQPSSNDQNHLAEELLKICQRMSSERDLAALLDLIANEATKLMGADRASLFLLDRERGELWSKVALGSGEIRFDARLGIAGAVALSGQTINVEDAHQDPRFYKEIDLRSGYRTRTLLAIPLRNHEGEIVGTFEVLNKKTGAFNKEDEEILKALAAQVAIAIETAQLVEEMKRHRDQLQEENAQLWKEVEGRFSTQSIIGTSEKIHAVLRLIDQISNSSVNVLITGESGTGKELAAKAIHYKSLRARKPFVALNCAALPESLVESELFGIERGVATGVERRLGKFEAANGGTLFLDEIGDLRQDLYYRLKVIHIQMPPLREIREDIPGLANYLLTNYCREMKLEPVNLTPEAASACMDYPWPGNVRELENEMKRLVLSVSGNTVAKKDLSEAIRRSGTEVVSSLSTPRFMKDVVCEIEKRMIQEALQQTKQNQLHAAKALGLSRHGLIKKMKRYNMRLRDS